MYRIAAHSGYAYGCIGRCQQEALLRCTLRQLPDLSERFKAGVLLVGGGRGPGAMGKPCSVAC